jgi:hypothetical protein
LFDTLLTDDVCIKIKFSKKTNFGGHSIRKSVLSWLLSFPNAVNQIYSIIQSGHSLGGALGLYVKLLISGVESIGRLKSGLKTTDSNYTTLPPRHNIYFLFLISF